LPSSASGVVVKDATGRVLTSETSGIVGDILIVNATLSPLLYPGQSTELIADYNLPTGSSMYNLNLTIFPAFNYYVDQAAFTFTPPEGATITSPQNSSLDSSSSLTTSTYQDALAVNRQGVSYVDSVTPIVNLLAISYNYNPVWSSFRPTFWALILSVIGCFGVIFWRKRPSSEKVPIKREVEKPSAEKAPVPQEKAKIKAPKSSLRLTKETLESFVEDYELRRDISSEIESLDEKAQRNKIPRSQYKTQRRSLETRFASLTKNIDERKQVLRNSGSGYADLIKKLESAEAVLGQAKQNIKNLNAKQNSGEISIEEYRLNIGDYTKDREKADSSITRILVELREKARY
jgi:hypothetical protein